MFAAYQGKLWDGTCAWLRQRTSRTNKYCDVLIVQMVLSVVVCLYPIVAFFIMSAQDEVVKNVTIIWHEMYQIWLGTNFTTCEVNRAIVVYFLNKNVTFPRMQIHTTFIHLIINLQTRKMQSSSSIIAFSISKGHNYYPFIKHSASHNINNAS